MANETVADVLKVAIPGFLALVGTAVAGYWGYRKWRTERRDTVADDYIQSRREAYRQLWARLQAAHELFENDSLKPAEIAEKVAGLERAIRLFFLREVHIDASDRDIVLTYLRNLAIMRTAQQTPGDHEGWDPKRMARGQIPKASAVIETAVNSSREILIRKIRHELGAPE